MTTNPGDTVPDKAAGDALTECDIKPRALDYPLSDYHRAVGNEGPLGYTWQDKPHRLVYDLIAAVRYYAAAQPAPTPGEQLAAALGWPGGISNPEQDWTALLREVARLRQPAPQAVPAGDALTDEQIDAVWENCVLTTQHDLHDVPEDQWDVVLRHNFARAVRAAGKE